eukprot:TRINITY_DN10152_c0_g2_i1.p1 TRINITY_DN10152_c0_g2~~TRINITY_DN10152_c0_g2_i1.p1  ORF type:complete len:568 (+),score=83.16 TRINITY_DN10152_c0_g2_i1:80-1783(+)
MLMVGGIQVPHTEDADCISESQQSMNANLSMSSGVEAETYKQDLCGKVDKEEPVCESKSQTTEIVTTTTTSTTSQTSNGFVKDIVKKWHENSRPKKVVTIVRAPRDSGYQKGQVQDKQKSKLLRTESKEYYKEQDQVVVTFLGGNKNSGLKKTEYSTITQGSSTPQRILSRNSSFEQQGTSISSDSTLATSSTNSLKGKYVPPHLRKTLSDSVDSFEIIAKQQQYTSLDLPTNETSDDAEQGGNDDAPPLNNHSSDSFHVDEAQQDTNNNNDIDIDNLNTDTDDNKNETSVQDGDVVCQEQVVDEQQQQQQLQEESTVKSSKLNANAADFTMNVNATEFNVTQFPPVWPQDMTVNMAGYMCGQDQGYIVGGIPCTMYDVYNGTIYGTYGEGMGYDACGYGDYYGEVYEEYVEDDTKPLTRIVSLSSSDTTYDGSVVSFGKPPKGRGGYNSSTKPQSAPWKKGRPSRDLDTDWNTQKERRNSYNKSKGLTNRSGSPARVVCAPRYKKKSGECEGDEVGDRIIEVPINTLKKTTENTKDTQQQFKVLLGNQGEKKEIVVGGGNSGSHYY